MRPRRAIRKVRNFLIYRVLHVDDTPHRIALGVAVGIFVTWTPTMGLQMAMTVVLAALLRANKLVGVPFVWISNPLTLVPVYGPNFWLGNHLIRFFGGKGYRFREFLKAMNDSLHLQGGWWDTVQSWWQTMYRFLTPLWVGSVVIGLVLGGLSYVITYQAVVIYRTRRYRLDERLRRLIDRRRTRHASQASCPADQPDKV